MTKEALKLALESLECALSDDRPYIVQCKEAITAIKEALAQPEQEPVAWEQFYPDMGKPQLAPPHPWEKFCDSNCVWTDHHPDCKLAQPEQKSVAMADYMALTEKYVALKAAQRTWVGLTDEEIADLYFDKFSMGELKAFARAIEAKLKEKNELR